MQSYNDLPNGYKLSKRLILGQFFNALVL